MCIQCVRPKAHLELRTTTMRSHCLCCSLFIIVYKPFHCFHSLLNEYNSERMLEKFKPLTWSLMFTKQCKMFGLNFKPSRSTETFLNFWRFSDRNCRRKKGDNWKLEFKSFRLVPPTLRFENLNLRQMPNNFKLDRISNCKWYSSDYWNDSSRLRLSQHQLD